MLVLSRRVGEAICIGNDIIVYVTRTKGSRVVLGIEAPQAIGIQRGELMEQPIIDPLSEPPECPTLPSWDSSDPSSPLTL